MKRIARIATLSVCMLLLIVLIVGMHSPPVRAQSPVIPWEPHIAIVWPHDGHGTGTPATRSTRVNVSVWPRGEVPINSEPPLNLLVAQTNEPTLVAAATPQRILRRVTGGVFASLEYNDVPADLRTQPNAQLKLITYGEVLGGRSEFHGNIWVHAADARTILPYPTLPVGRADQSALPRYETRIQIVWPHDGKGNPMPVTRANAVNVAVEVFEPGTRRAVIPDAYGAFPFTLTLLAARGNDPLQPMTQPAQLTGYAVGGQVYPRWEFNNVPVVPGAQTHFVVALLPTGSRAVSPHSTIWTHAADPRTILPHPVAPPPALPAPAVFDRYQPQIAVARTVGWGEPSPYDQTTHIFYGGSFGGWHTDLMPHTPAGHWSPAFSPDGRWLAFMSDHGATRYANALFVMYADGTDMRRLSTQRYPMVYGPVFWSRDGQRVALRLPDNSYHIYRLDGVGPEAQRALPIEEWRWPNDSPDGRYRVVPCGDPADRSLAGGLFCLRDLQGREATNPFSAPPQRLVTWSPDGAWIVYDENARVYRIRPEGTDLQEMGEGTSPSWQPRPLQ